MAEATSALSASILNNSQSSSYSSLVLGTHEPFEKNQSFSNRVNGWNDYRKLMYLLTGCQYCDSSSLVGVAVGTLLGNYAPQDKGLRKSLYHMLGLQIQILQLLTQSWHCVVFAESCVKLSFSFCLKSYLLSMILTSSWLCQWTWIPRHYCHPMPAPLKHQLLQQGHGEY